MNVSMATSAMAKQIPMKETGSLFTLRNRAGSRSKTKGIEAEILEELENDNYHTQRQIADMIKDRFGISISLPAVARFLKKTASNG